MPANVSRMVERPEPTTSPGGALNASVRATTCAYPSRAFNDCARKAGAQLTT
jgi:hypothetical protein